MTKNLNNGWEKIQQGIHDAERLIRHKEYNASMIKCRQTLEFMVKLLAERAGIADGSDLKTMIDTLYENRWVSKSTCEHYHKIRIIGNKAAHEGDANTYSANQAYHILSQEVYTFANDYRNAHRGTKPSSRSPQRKRQQDVRRASTAAHSRGKYPRRATIFTVYRILKLLAPILCIILLFCIMKLVKPEKNAVETSAPPTTISVTESGADRETFVPETMSPVSYKTTAVLNIRSQPNTEGNRIGQLGEGVTVEYIRAYDTDWAVIMYNGQEAYVASRYLTSQ